MTSLWFRLTCAAVRAWTHVYTWRLPAGARDARREDIASHLWEESHDGDSLCDVRHALSVLWRLIRGVPHDLAWRVEEEVTMTRSYAVRVAVAALIAVAAGIWIAVAGRNVQAPAPPGPPLPARAGIGYLPSPAPPPPPPGGAPREGSGQHAQTSFTVADQVNAPTRIAGASPVYPPIAIAYGVRGRVVLEATVDQHGRVVATRVIHSVPVLDEAAVNAVRQWQFEPAAAPVVITVTAAFGV